MNKSISLKFELTGRILKDWKKSSLVQNKYTYLVFLAGIIVFTVGLGQSFVGFDCRFAVFAKEMLRNGPSFFPTTYGQPYPDYPGTSTFLIYLVSLPFGKVTHFTTVLPTAIVSALVLALIYKVGAIHSRKWGAFAVLSALFTIDFFSHSRSISTDQYVILSTVLCFYLAYSGDVYKRQNRFLFIPLLLIFGFAFRGPIGLIIPASVICSYYLYCRDFRKFALMSSLSLVLLVLCSTALLAAARYQGGDAFVKQVIDAQVTGRIGGSSRHWIGYYFTESFGRYTLSYPFAVLVVAVLYKKIFTGKDGQYRLLALLVIWIMVVLVGMSVPSAKKIRYVLPMIPAVALVGSYMFVFPFRNNILSSVKDIFLGFCLWFPLGIGIFSLSALVLSRRFDSLLGANYLLSAIPTILLAFASWVLNAKLKNDDRKDIALMAVGTLTFIITVICIIEPIDYYHRNTRPFVEKVEALQAVKSGEVVFYKIGADSEAIQFMANLDKPLRPQFITSPDDILKNQMPAYFIAVKRDFEQLPEYIKSSMRLLNVGKIGHDDCVVFVSQV